MSLPLTFEELVLVRQFAIDRAVQLLGHRQPVHPEEVYVKYAAAFESFILRTEPGKVTEAFPLPKTTTGPVTDAEAREIRDRTARDGERLAAYYRAGGKRRQP